MLRCKEEAMGKAYGIREMGLKIRQLFGLMSSLQHGPACLSGGLPALQEHHACWEARATEPEPVATSWPTHPWHSRGAPSNFPL